MTLEKIGRYRIEGELGRGAMGQVFLAHDPNIGRRLAIKTIPLDTANAEARGRFQREVQAAGRLAHPNIVTIFDAGEQDGVVYIAMELVNGETLAEVLASGPLSAEQTISIGLQVAAGLAHAHEQGIIHRDIKPANIMVSAATAKVMDFGVARLASSGFTSTGQVLGTPAYLAPEVIQGQTADARADLFSLGVALYECLTGKRAFDGENISAVMFQVLTERPAAPQAIDPRLPSALSELVMKLMEKQPEDRLQSCPDLIAALKQLQLDMFGPGASAPVLSRQTAKSTGDSSGNSASSFRVATLADAAAISPDSPAATLPATPQAPEAAASPAVPATGKSNWRSTMAAVAALLILAVALGPWWRGRRGGADSSAAGQINPAAAAQPARPAPPPPPPKPTTGTVQLTSTPPGARISVNGRSSGQMTPSKLELPPGTHKIRLEAEGFNRQEREVTLEAGESFVVHVEMRKRGLLRRMNPF